MSGRHFKPPPVGDQTLGAILRYNPRDSFCHIVTQTYRGPRVTGDIAISIDGACTNNGNPNARASMGVFFGPNSRYNYNRLLTNGPLTNQRAEIWAAIIALQHVKQLKMSGLLDARRVVLIADSEYLVKAMTFRVYHWRDNGWIGSYGRRVVNWSDFEALDDLIEELRVEYDVDVKFWLVDRSWNNAADREAKKALRFGQGLHPFFAALIAERDS
ncbi:hypothetical protein NP233_g11702 [Leucocoprinus birnbaumii]|uniref:ribonuclease H n=1 Tax=Leucocoprinus birnbaumii TaxID=56174 RepID=A0AAD5VGM2_9AGAR|nr:hypothetical protein NP233_g11702 [Leucocoprinus birnbaumii]